MLLYSERGKEIKYIIIYTLYIGLYVNFFAHTGATEVKRGSVAWGGGGGYGKNIMILLRNITIHNFITILCHVGFTILQVS